MKSWNKWFIWGWCREDEVQNSVSLLNAFQLRVHQMIDRTPPMKKTMSQRKHYKHHGNCWKRPSHNDLYIIIMQTLRPTHSAGHCIILAPGAENFQASTTTFGRLLAWKLSASCARMMGWLAPHFMAWGKSSTCRDCFQKSPCDACNICSGSAFCSFRVSCIWIEAHAIGFLLFLISDLVGSPQVFSMMLLDPMAGVTNILAYNSLRPQHEWSRNGDNGRYSSKHLECTILANPAP